MIKAELKRLYSVHIPDSPPTLPPNPSSCVVQVYADIGDSEGDAADQFEFWVRAPLPPIPERVGEPWWWDDDHTLYMDRFDWREIEEAVINICRGIEGNDWEEVAKHLVRYFNWEYEGYKGP